MHVRTVLYVLSKVQSLFNLRWIRKATILYQGQSLRIRITGQATLENDGERTLEHSSHAGVEIIAVWCRAAVMMSFGWIRDINR